MATPQFLCANWDPDNTRCQKVGKYGCRNCRLVLVSTEQGNTTRLVSRA